MGRSADRKALENTKKKKKKKAKKAKSAKSGGGKTCDALDSDVVSILRAGRAAHVIAALESTPGRKCKILHLLQHRSHIFLLYFILLISPPAHSLSAALTSSGGSSRSDGPSKYSPVGEAFLVMRSDDDARTLQVHVTGDLQLAAPCC